MSACCVPGCKNRNSAANTIKFYRIPSGKRPFQANRRRLWLRAIHGAGGSTEEIKSGARICGAHFVSGEASLDHDDPDFVPSVFASNKHKRRVKRLYGRRRRRRNKAAGKTAPPDDESPVDLQAFACLESESELPDATGTTSEPSLPKEVEPLSKADEATLSTNSPSLSAHTNQSCAPSPVVLLKSVVAPAGGFQCELCSRNFAQVSELLQHKLGHDKDKNTYICEICGKHLLGQSDFAEHQRFHVESYSCNMCHRSFSTSQNLKRHKLLHVKDGRKCPLCGILFCRRHNHILFLPKPDPMSESEPDCSDTEPQNLNSSLMPENKQMEKSISSEAPAPQKPATRVFAPQAPAPQISVPQVSATQILALQIPEPEEPAPKTLAPQIHATRIFAPQEPGLQSIFSLPRPPPPVPKYLRTSSRRKGRQDAASLPPPPPKHSELPASLRVFSPLYLTSASLEVKRNYEYILSKPKKKVKQEVEQPLFSPNARGDRQVRKQRVAYDMEIVL